MMYTHNLDCIANLKTLCNLHGISGREYKIRSAIISMIDGFCEHKTDNIGNLICYKKGLNGERAQKLMVSAHMDEVGLIITEITDKGYLRFSSVGGIDPRVLVGINVLINDMDDNFIPGVIGIKPIHFLNAAEKDTAPKEENLLIDIGSKSKEQTEKYVKLGSSVNFFENYTELGNEYICSKALDNRFGCAAMVDIIKKDVQYDTYFAFTVQEEIGTRGVATAAYAIQPDISLVLEATTACDIEGVDTSKQVCKINGGAVVPFMDKSNIYDYELYKKVINFAKNNNIPAQTKNVIAGGNDSGTIAKTGSGVKTIAMAIPCRYIHTPSCMASILDIKNTTKLAALFVNDFKFS